MSRTRRTYSAEYKTESARLVIRTGRPIADVARQLGIREQMLGRWVKAERSAMGEDAPVVRPDFTAPPAPEDTEHTGPTLRDEVQQAIEAMQDTQDSDQGLKALAVRYAEQIDAGIARGGKEATKVMYLGPHLFNVLRELGGSPTIRKSGAPAAGPAPKKGRLSLLREARGGGVGDQGDATG